MPWWKRWLGGDWGREHNSAIYWFCMDDDAITRIYRELVVNHHSPEQLGERMVQMSKGHDNRLESYEFFSFSHDAFAQRTDPNTIAVRIGRVLEAAGLCGPTISTKDKPGREQILYDKLRGRIRTSKHFTKPDGTLGFIVEPALQIADTCKELIQTIPRAPRDEDNVEEIAEFLGDDPIAGAGYGLYAKFGKPANKPLDVRVKERIQDFAEKRVTTVEKLDPNTIAMLSRKAERIERSKGHHTVQRWRPGMRRN
jgi:hypothetical protein